jgi:hypothetical protein
MTNLMCSNADKNGALLLEHLHHRPERSDEGHDEQERVPKYETAHSPPELFEPNLVDASQLVLLSIASPNLLHRAFPAVTPTIGRS